MKKLFTLTLFTFLASVAFSQGIAFSYDDSGNCTSRRIINTPFKSSEETENVSPEEFAIGGDTQLKLYPNPTSGMLYFEIIGNTSSNAVVKVKLYSVKGKLIYKKVFHSEEFVIDITEEKNGIYLLDMTINNKAKNFTIIKK